MSRIQGEERNDVILGEGQKYDFFSFEDLWQIEIGGAMKIYLNRYSSVFKKMANGSDPDGSELGLEIYL